MAQIPIDLSGRKGLSPRYQGDVEGVASIPQERYLGAEGQMSEGIWNPFLKYGYLSPANNTHTPLTGTISDTIVSDAYDAVNDDLYIGTDGPNFLKIDGFKDTSLSPYLTIDSDRDIVDMELYEVAGKRACVYATDSYDIGDGMSIGFFGLDNDSGLVVFDSQVIAAGGKFTYETIGNSDTNEKLSQMILYGTDVDIRYKKCDRIRLRLSRLGAGTSYTIKVGIQRTSESSSSSPSGVYIAYGTIDPSTIAQVTDGDVNGQDIYVNLDTTVTFDSTKYWIVVEPTVYGDMTGTNSFVWYRSDEYTSLYSNGNTYAYASAAWSVADITNESFDFSLMLSKTENWFPVKDPSINTFTYKSKYTNSSMNNTIQDAIYLDENHFISVFEGTGEDGYVRTFFVSYDGTISSLGELEFDTIKASNSQLAKIDNTHFLIFWQQSSGAPRVQAFTIDGSYNITAVGSPLVVTVPGAGDGYVVGVQMVTSTKAVLLYLDQVQGDATLQTISIDGSYNVTALGSPTDLDTGASTIALDSSSMGLLTGSYVACVWRGTDGDGYTQVFEVNTSTGTITLKGSPVEIETESTNGYSLQIIDSTHYVIAGNINTEGSGICIQCYTVDGSYNVSAIGNHGVIERYEGGVVDIKKLEDYSYCMIYRGVNSYHYITSFKIDSSYNIVLSSSKIQATNNVSTDDDFVLIVMNKNLVIHAYLNYPTTAFTDYASYSVSYVYDDDNFYVEEGQSTFIRRADNGLLYWFVGPLVHTIDGSSTGGLVGSITKEVLTFPSYLTSVDAVDTGGYMFIGVHSLLNASGYSDVRTFSSDPAGVYVWDRLSSIVRTRDYIPLQGVREIKRLFVSCNNDVMLFCINNSKQTELRKYNNGRFEIVQKLGVDGYPPYRNSLKYSGNMAVWLSNDGTIYAYGQSEYTEGESLYKIGSIENQASGTLTPGILISGNDLTSGTPRAAAFISWMDNATNKLTKWQINGVGTVDGVQQKGHVGNIYTMTYEFPAPTLISFAHVFALPTVDSGVDNSTVISTIKVYFNKKTTAERTYEITRHDILDGYVFLPINRKNATSVQFEIEYPTTQVLGSYDFNPSRLVLNYNPEPESKK